MKRTLLAISIFAITCNASASSSPDAVSSMSDRYSTLANLEMNGGFPTETSQKTLQNESYFQRASMLYQWALPIVNMKAMQEGHAELMNGTAYNKIAIYQDRLKPNSLITTPNSDVIYAMGWLDMKETGPLIIEHPAGLQSLMDDMYHHPLRGPLDKNQPGGQYLGDIGNAGPDKGKAAKFLILPPNKKREDYAQLADKYFIYESNTSEVFLFLRSFFKDMNNLEPAVNRVKEIKVYPLNGSAESMEFFNVSDVPSKSIWDNDYRFYETLNRAVQNMELATFDPYMNGVMAAIGISKGAEFTPTEKQKEMLTKAAQTGWKISKEIALNFDEKSSKTTGDTWFWKEAPSWVAHALTDKGNQYHALSDPYYHNIKTGYTNVDAITHMYTNHYSMSSGMINAKIGAGAKYAGAYKDKDLNPLIGSCNYSLRIPADVPASLFWSVTAYDAATAAGVNVENHQWPSLGDRDNPIKNSDDSITLFFGPTAPENVQLAKNNWLQFDNDSWFSLIRFYGPQQSLFDGSWVPGEFEKINCVK
ncbi:CDP-4-dehydro-6-deoxy-D-glucose 3-dehydratase [Aliivibrio fischeri MJ11]|uniref:CDP-4-dehydro-6-deoxy-D-glucose 3-dehydratase n=1 Tax=Aliivibrio fischeri (strain MJ11) TaxID=388396 RepID=B5FDF0_ALIFM|nr:DUF1254 domain-containing protein [Aliivibrio fischeri]ACH66678.1 CDP-4-dehydro-6-deoxy-D-glucose 3-dehydratase [Aliivibrio fischeri MJ11]